MINKILEELEKTDQKHQHTDCLHSMLLIKKGLLLIKRIIIKK